jgi:hypothetical protein
MLTLIELRSTYTTIWSLTQFEISYIEAMLLLLLHITTFHCGGQTTVRHYRLFKQLHKSYG